MGTQVERNRRYMMKLKLEAIGKVGGKCCNPFNKDHGDFLFNFECLRVVRIEDNKIVYSVEGYEGAMLFPEAHMVLCLNCLKIRKNMSKLDIS